MPNYSKGSIYMIKKQDDYDNENVYIGSTCNFTRRKNMHKTTCNNENNKNYNFKLYKYIRENGGWDAWIMTKIIDYPCNNRSELNIMERNYIDNYKSKLNCQIPTRTQKEYRNDNKEKLVELKKQWCIDNKDKIVEQKKQWYNENRDKILEKQKEYSKDNVDKIAKYQKEYYEANKDKILEQVKQYKNDNKNKILEKHKKTKTCINFNSK